MQWLLLNKNEAYVEIKTSVGIEEKFCTVEKDPQRIHNKLTYRLWDNNICGDQENGR